MRLDGVGSEYADLLEAAGVDSPSELAAAQRGEPRHDVPGGRRGPSGTVRRIPSEETVAGWIEQAKTLDKAVSH